MSSKTAKNMSWKEVKKSSQKPNLVIENEDLEGLGNDSIFSALSDIDNKEQKKINESTNENTKPKTNNNGLSSPKSSKKKQETSQKNVPIDALSNLNVSNFINKNIKITNSEQDQTDQLKKLCNFIESEIAHKLGCTTTKFSHKSFDIDNESFKGPIHYLNPNERKEIEKVFLKCNESAIKKLFSLITKCIFVGEKKATSAQTISNTIAHQLCVQIISNLYPGILYQLGENDKPVYDQVISRYQNIIEKSPAIGNTLIWVCKQQHYTINKKEVLCPEYVNLWMKYFINALTSQDASVTIQTQSVILLNKVLDGIKENKKKLNVTVKILLRQLISLIAVIKIKSTASQIMKHDKLYEGIMKAYASLKSLLFDSSCNVLQLNSSNNDMFYELYELLSDPNYDRAAFNEFLNIIVLTFANEPALLYAWASKYIKSSNVTLSNAIVKEIKDQQTDYFKNKKRCSADNCWLKLDNDQLKDTLLTIINFNKSNNKKLNNSKEIDEMNENIKIILRKISGGSKNGGLFGGFVFKLLKRLILLVLIISFSLHVFGTFDNLMRTNDGNKLPAGHPPIPKNGGDINNCPYHAFTKKYKNCEQCHPIIKFTYDAMDRPYKYVESNAIIPVYNKVWEPYCSKFFLSTVSHNVIPSFRYLRPVVSEKVVEPAMNIINNNIIPKFQFLKPIVSEKVVEPVQRNVIPKVTEFYNIYAKEYIDKTNKLVIIPAIAASSKYANEAYVVIKPMTIKAYEYTINNIIKPSIPYINKAKVNAIQYSNQLLDTLADIPYKKLVKDGASYTLKVIGNAENYAEKLVHDSTPYVKKYWSVLTRKAEVVMKQESVQKVLENQYVVVTLNTVKDVYRIWCEGVKISYVYLTRRGPTTNSSKNWKEATQKVSVKKDLMNSVVVAKRFFNNLIEKLDNENVVEIKKENVESKRDAPELKQKQEEDIKLVKEKKDEDNMENITETKKVIIKQAVKETKQIAMAKAETKKVFQDKIDFETKKVIMAETQNKENIKKVAEEAAAAAKHIAKEKAKAKIRTKKLLKDEYIAAKQAAQETETTKQIAMNNAAKRVAMEQANMRDEL